MMVYWLEGIILIWKQTCKTILVFPVYCLMHLTVSQLSQMELAGHDNLHYCLLKPDEKKPMHLVFILLYSCWTKLQLWPHNQSTYHSMTSAHH